jgi:hypothetical protein
MGSGRLLGRRVRRQQALRGSGGLSTGSESSHGERRDAAVARFSEHSVADDLEPLSIDAVTGSGPFRMYRAAVTAAFMLEDERDFRTPVEL